MARFEIVIEVENDAFTARGIGQETARILREQVIPAVIDGDLGKNLLDGNGNTVGHLAFISYETEFSRRYRNGPPR